MEDSQEILLNSLANIGVPIPPDVLSVEDLTPEALVSICAHSLRIISNSESFPVTLPESMADRFKICTDLASSVKDLGYIGDMSFHKFLYPSKEDMYKLIRFLVGRLSESSQTANTTVNIENLEKSSNDADDEGQNLHTKVEALKLRTIEVGPNSIQYSEENVAADNGNNGGNSEINCQHKLEQALMSLQDESPQTSDKTQMLQNQENVFSDEMTANSLELQQLEEQQNMLKLAVEMACDEQTPFDSYVTQLTKQIDAKSHNLAQLESKWKATIRPLEEKKRNLEEALFAKQPKSQEKHKKLEQDLVSVLSETAQREEDISKLSTEIEKLPKIATRKSYIERIKEITKNSRKQDSDIARILKETRELQLESNMIQERLHRTYAVMDETLMREAKKDQVGERAHMLLTEIHECFEEISEKILATDRTRREFTDLETKLLSIYARTLNIDKLQADLDAIKKENEYLQVTISHSST